MSASVPDPVLAIDIGGSSLRLGLISPAGDLIGEITRYDVPFAEDGAADVDRLLDLMADHVYQAKS